LNTKTFQQIFQSYFHSKYTFQDFLDVKLTILSNFFEKNINNHTFFSYKNQQKRYTPASQMLYDFHTFLNSILLQTIVINRCVFSYKKNTSVYDMVYLHKDNKYYFKTDIKSFFNNIDDNLIKNSLIENDDNFPIGTQEYLPHIINILSYDDKLPIGFVTSPTISNIVLYKFDDIIEKYCEENNIIYTRYSDDLIFSTNDRTKLKDLEVKIENTFKNLYDDKFLLNEEKTKYLDKTKKVKVLGLIITPDGHITVDKTKKENIKQLLYFYKNDKMKFRLLLDEKYNGKFSKAYGMLNYISDIDKSFIGYLRKKYGNFIVDKFLHGAK